MSFTNISLVKKHISEHHLGVFEMENHPCHLTGSSPLKLPDSNIQVGSEKVKGKEILSPVQEEVSFLSGDTIQLLHSELILDTVVVASDSSLGQVYVENIDYSIDYDNGKLTRISSGSILALSSVVIFYLYYRIYQKDTDYKLDFQKGELTRIASGEIEDGQWVLLDYKVEYGFLNDETIAQAIAEANERILKFIDPSYYESEDQGLVTTETYLSVSILCDIKAVEVLNLNIYGANAQLLSKSWNMMAEVYSKKAYLILSDFARISSALLTPRAVKSEM
ncbi:MAG: hypothetical protein Q8N71_05865 [candidate division Zixibacteria bacterium]|nr:hypothetical protein [candidate division Zixibacteria bacterium]